MDKMTRRSFVTRSFVTTAGVATLLPPVTDHVRRQPAPDPQCCRYRFFDAAEARFIEPACERLIPADASGSGATTAGVAEYLDRHLAGPWGAGEQPYRPGSWQPGSPLPAGCPARSPAALFRVTLRALDARFESGGTPFGRLPVAVQDAFLASLQDGTADFPGVPVDAFFAALLGMTVEGFFSNPRHGPRRDRIAWRLGGFPGAYAARG